MNSTVVPALALRHVLPDVRERLKTGILLIVALACGQLAVIAQVMSVWTTGSYPDTDDAMRMVQVRNLMNGRAWFDLTEPRLDPPSGVFSHWSRLIDAPLVVFVKAFGLFLPPDMAERMARVAYPILLTGLLYIAIMLLCRALLGRKSALFALVGAFLTEPFMAQFQPGRIDHHSVQIILLTLTIAALVASVRQPRWAAWAAAAIAYSLAISLENLPFMLVAAALPAFWIAYGQQCDRQRLLWFAAGAAMATPVFFLATVAPDRWFLLVTDALSGAHVVVILGCALCCAMLAGATPFLKDARSRFILASALAGLAAAAILWFLPGLLRGPFADVDAVVRRNWLDKVYEVQPVFVIFHLNPLSCFASVTPLLVGLLGGLLACRRCRGVERLQWIMLTVPLAVGVLCTGWMMRTAYSTSPLTTPGLIYFGFAVQSWAAQRTKAIGELGAVLFLMSIFSMPGLTSIGQFFLADDGASTAIAKTSPPGETPAASPVAPPNCDAPATIKSLAALPAGLVFGDIDLGPYILADTPHSVLAAPYHRNTHGNRLVLQAMEASPDQIRALIRDSHADYVVFCGATTKGWKTSGAHLNDGLGADAQNEFIAVPVGAPALTVFKVNHSVPPAHS